VFAPTIHAQQPIVYPAKGQSAQQQNKDNYECYAWAKQTTGVDPAGPPPSVAPPPQSSWGGGHRLGGAARGALGGAAIGAIAGDAGQGAAIGAVAGTMAGGYRARRDRDQSIKDAQAQQGQVMNTYYRAFGACMEGRGYSIK
jgi:hypothetical protein